MLKRHEIEVLLKAGHPKVQVAGLAGISLSSVKRIAEESPVVHVDDVAERGKRGIGRPSQVENFRKLVVEILEEKADLPSVEILRRVREAGYRGGKSALYGLAASLRPKEVKPLVRFEGLPGEFSQQDFGQVDVEFRDGSVRRIRFFASRLKYSRWVRVSIVKDETVETLVRSLAQHLASWGGAPLVCVFDRPKTVALKWRRNGEVTEWNPAVAAGHHSGAPPLSPPAEMRIPWRRGTSHKLGPAGRIPPAWWCNRSSWLRPSRPPQARGAREGG